MKTHREDHLRIAEEAAEWLYRLHEQGEDVACLSGLTAWLKQSPRHVEQFLMITAVSKELDAVDPERRIDVRALLDETQDNLVPLRTGVERARPADARRFPRLRDRRFLKLAGVAILLLFVGATAWWRFAGQSTYSTAVGEQRLVKLEDGSMMYLNTHSRAQVRYTQQAREVRLLEGEALFSVEGNPQRPFVVTAGETVVRAIGTQFNVLKRGDGTTVSVVEGKVQVSMQSAPGVAREDTGMAAQLTAGEQASVANSGDIQKRAVADIDEMVAWRERRLIFRDSTLADVVAEFNRYNRSPRFHVEGTTVAARRYTGTFDADDPESLQELLAKEMDLALSHEGTEIVIRAR